METIAFDFLSCPLCHHTLEEAVVAQLKQPAQEWSPQQGIQPCAVCNTCQHLIRKPLKSKAISGQQVPCKRCQQTMPADAPFCASCRAPQDRAIYAKALWNHVRNNEDDVATTYFPYKRYVEDNFRAPLKLAAPWLQGTLDQATLTTNIQAGGYKILSQQAAALDPHDDAPWKLVMQVQSPRETRNVTFFPYPFIDIPESQIGNQALENWLDLHEPQGLAAESKLGENIAAGYANLAAILAAATQNAPIIQDVELDEGHPLATMLALKSPFPRDLYARVSDDGDDDLDEPLLTLNTTLVVGQKDLMRFRCTQGLARLGLPELAILRPDHKTLTPIQRRVRREAESQFLHTAYQYISHHGLPLPGVPFVMGSRTLCWHMAREVLYDANNKQDSGGRTAWDPITGNYSNEEDLCAFLLEVKGQAWDLLHVPDLTPEQSRIDPSTLNPENDEDHIWEDEKPSFKPSPIAAALASLAWPGTGQLWLGETTRGLIYIVISLCTFCVCGLANIVSAVDAYILALPDDEDDDDEDYVDEEEG